MDAVSLSTALSAGAVSSQTGVALLRSIEGLDKKLAAQLFASIGVGSVIDARA
jgi:hypothetical protein